MTRDLLRRAADEVDASMEDATDPEVRDRLETLGEHLRSQAERDATPALGALDRIQHGLGEVATETDDATVRDRLEDARERIFSFLETLDDRGMQQHGGTTESDGP